MEYTIIKRNINYISYGNFNLVIIIATNIKEIKINCENISEYSKYKNQISKDLLDNNIYLKIKI